MTKQQKHKQSKKYKISQAARMWASDWAFDGCSCWSLKDYSQGKEPEEVLTMELIMKAFDAGVQHERKKILEKAKKIGMEVTYAAYGQDFDVIKRERKWLVPFYEVEQITNSDRE